MEVTKRYVYDIAINSKETRRVKDVHNNCINCVRNNSSIVKKIRKKTRQEVKISIYDKSKIR